MLITSVVFDVTKSVITELTASVSALRAFEQNRARAGVWSKWRWRVARPSRLVPHVIKYVRRGRYDHESNTHFV